MLPAKDLGSILTTFNYALYLCAYFDAKAHKLKTNVLSLISPLKGAAVVLAGPTQAETSSFAKLGSVFSNARATLRLFGLLPLYVKARKLMNDSEGMDQALHFIESLQCSFFAAFQLLENLAFLTNSGVFSAHGLGRLLGSPGGKRVAMMYKIAHRAWFLGIVCDFVRLLREAQLFFHKKHVQNGEITQEEAEKAVQWYYEWIRPLAWLPIGWKLSAWTDDAVAGVHMGFQGIAGVLADLRKTSLLWHATEEMGVIHVD